MSGKDAFLLGAGFSRAVSDAMPLMGDFADELPQLLQAQVGRRSRDEQVWRIDDLRDSYGNDVESWLTHLSRGQPWLSESENTRNRALYLDLLKAIASLIGRRTRQATENSCPRWLRQLFLMWEAKASVVITLNYDTLVERAEKVFTDGLSDKELTDRSVVLSKKPVFPMYPLNIIPQPVIGDLYTTADWLNFEFYKLHGSINWYYSGTSSLAGEQITYVGPSTWDSYVDPDSLTVGPGSNVEELRTKAVAMKAPLIAPPVSEKSPYLEHEVMRVIWTGAAAGIKQAERIFCLGYSLPPTDSMMLRFLRDSRPPSRVKFFPVLTDPAVADGFREKLSARWFDVDTQFTRPACPIPQLVDALRRGDT